MKYDVAIIGAGPGGYVAAIRSAQAGFSTVLIEKDQIGGTCLNRGCIPTKSFVAVAERFLEISSLSHEPLESIGIEGVDRSKAAINIQKIVERKNKIVVGLRNGIAQLIKSNKITHIAGKAEFVTNTSLKVVSKDVEQTVEAENFIIATGSDWKELPGLKTNGQNIVTSDEMLDLSEIPQKLLVIGGGVIGSEFASIMNLFGASVTMVEMMDQILPLEDPFIARQLTTSLKKRGINILTKSTIKSLEPVNGKVKAVFYNDTTDEFDKVLVSIGRKPVTDGLNLEKIGVATNRGFVITNELMETNVKGIYAIGDCATPKDFIKPALAHVASFEGGVAIENIAAKKNGTNPEKMDYDVVPRPIFTIPELGLVGKTEKELKNSSIKYTIGRFMFGALSKAVCDGKTEGLMVTYADESGKILGAHAFGSHATDLCSEVALAMRNGLSIEAVAKTIHAHPTYSEMVLESLEDAVGKAVHKAKSLR